MDIPNGFYRTSVKTLIYDNGGKFLLCHEKNDTWDFPGGAIEFGENVYETLKREVKEEMGLEIIKIDKRPKYFITFKKSEVVWKASIFFEVEVKNLNFTPSNECRDIKFFDKNEAKLVSGFGIKEFLEIYEK